MFSLIRVSQQMATHTKYFLDQGQQLVKVAGDTRPSYEMSGLLYHKNGTRGDWIMLSVPNALVRGAFQALDAPGIQLPPSGKDNQLHAHISVILPDELELVGGPDKITERGKSFSYRLGGLDTVQPAGWSEFSQCWMLRVHSPELQALRRSYGLPSLPNQGKHDFHVTIAVRKRGVLGRNETGKDVSLHPVSS